MAGVIRLAGASWISRALFCASPLMMPLIHPSLKQTKHYPWTYWHEFMIMSFLIVRSRNFKLFLLWLDFKFLCRNAIPNHQLFHLQTLQNWSHQSYSQRGYWWSNLPHCQLQQVLCLEVSPHVHWTKNKWINLWWSIEILNRSEIGKIKFASTG